MIEMELKLLKSKAREINMAKGKKRKGFKEDVEVYRHEADKRKNAVPVGLASYDTSKPKPKKYEYDPQKL